MILSIVIPTFNIEAYVDSCLLSVETALNQIDGGIEVVIVDDASTDRTRDIIAQHQRTIPQLTVIQHSRNQGPAVSRNSGIRHAVGEWVLFLDGDNLIYPETLKFILGKILPIYQEDVFILGMALIDQNGIPIGKFYGDYLKVNPADILNNMPYFLLQDNFMDNFALVRRRLLLPDGYDTSLPYLEDWDLWIRLTYHVGASFRFIPETLGAYRVRTDSLHTSFGMQNPRYVNALIQVYAKSLSTINMPNDIRQRILSNVMYLSSSFAENTGYDRWT